ncbi:CFI-box-CTERM domain-containing protein [Altererythrobacter lutimaris]|uniref:Uncharacterized protein n=1 Tax=Altererythrobacter lutimaris TaxID=2743979 RepID=A0A850HCW7_9SPHN|nr:CFI-box-CTERM domain-containing protein [Altererythrobacter lutimaris]NVE94806.1 hypothetical protein [Altererythrobacter lutimaris]
MARAFSNTRRRLLAGLLVTGFAGPSALAQSGGQAAGCNFSVEVSAKVPELTGSISPAGESMTAILLPDRAEGTKGASTYVALEFQGFNRDAPRMWLHHSDRTAGSPLLGGKMRWTSGGRTHSPLRSITLSPMSPPSFLILKPNDYLVNAISVEIWYKGSDPEGPWDERYHFRAASFLQIRSVGEAQMVALRRKRDQAQCDATLAPPPTGCFLTTAAVEMLGLPDDCWELEQLRNFRDGWLLKQPGGSEQVSEYYSRAPNIANKLRSDPQRLAKLYLSHILPAAIAVRFGLNTCARALYTRMMLQVSDLG